MESREDKCSVKIWELHSDVYRDSSVESDTNNFPSGLIETQWNIIHAFFCLLSSPSHSSICILFCLCHFARPVLFKKYRAIEKLPLYLERSAKHMGFWRLLINFTTKVTVVKPSKRWLVQLKAFVDGVCLQSKRFFSVLFSQIIFLLEADTLTLSLPEWLYRF